MAADDRRLGRLHPSRTKALQIPRHLSTQWQVSGIEPLNLLHAGASILGKVEDVHLPLAEDDPHTDCSVPQGIDGVILVGERIVLDPRRYQKSVSER